MKARASIFAALLCVAVACTSTTDRDEHSAAEAIVSTDAGCDACARDAQIPGDAGGADGSGNAGVCAEVTDQQGSCPNALPHFWHCPKGAQAGQLPSTLGENCSAMGMMFQTAYGVDLCCK